VDLDAIWNAQALPPALADFIAAVSVHANAHVTTPPGGQNITEWCKKELCWERFRDLEIAIPAGVQQLLITREERTRRSSNHTLEEQTTVEEDEVIARVSAIASETWFSLSAWAKDTQSLQPWQRGLSFSLGRLASQGRAPSRRQAAHGERILAEARELGFRG
jgi:hypothetical protein